MRPKIVSSLLAGVYVTSATACVVCLVWVAKAVIFSHFSVLILTLLTPGVLTSAVIYLGWDDWDNHPKIRIIFPETDEDYDNE